jgi:hypothetical protein
MIRKGKKNFHNPKSNCNFVVENHHIMRTLYRFLLCIFLSLTVLTAFSRKPYSSSYRFDPEELQFGIRAGVNASIITGIPQLLVPEGFYSNYSFSEHWNFNPDVSLVASYPFEKSWLSLEVALSYYNITGKVHYEDIYALNYDVNFRQHYVGLEVLCRLWLFRDGSFKSNQATHGGFNLALGLRGGVDVNREGNVIKRLTYKSNANDYDETDKEIEEACRKVIKSKPELSAVAKIGYQFSFGLSFDFGYYYSFFDIVETKTNPYRFIDNKNNAHVVQFTLSYSFSVR